MNTVSMLLDAALVLLNVVAIVSSFVGFASSLKSAFTYVSTQPVNPSDGFNYMRKMERGIEGSAINEKTRVGRWMSQKEYNAMVKTGKVQMSPNGNTTYVSNPASSTAFRAAPKGSIYVEFDVPTSSVYSAGKQGWAQIPGPNSLIDRLNQSKGLPPITEMPSGTNIHVMGRS